MLAAQSSALLRQALNTNNNLGGQSRNNTTPRSNSAFSALKAPSSIIENSANKLASSDSELIISDNKPSLLSKLFKSGKDSLVWATDKLLSTFAADPKAVATISSGLASLGIDLLPFLGPLKKIADGRALFQQDCPELKTEGRTLCLIALLELGIDAATAGGSVLLPDEILTYPRMLRDYQRRMKQEENPSKMFPDPISLAVRAILKIPAISKLVDRAITATIPE